tara:strand:+ start:400 stop:624 length:225 start_codon:yes stop_codon:yes gene_type:complete
VLKLFYDAKGKVADAFYERYGRLSNTHKSQAEDIWNDNVGPSFEWLVKNLKYIYVDPNTFDNPVLRSIEKHEEE